VECDRIEIELADGASLNTLIHKLQMKVPSLTGEVISPLSFTLTEAYAFNINGKFHHGDMNNKIYKGDRIAIILLTTGG
jgi:hypothetical protein